MIAIKCSTRPRSFAPCGDAAPAGIPALDQARAEAALAAFAMAGQAAVLFDELGEVLQLNCLAKKLLGPDLDIVQQQLIATDSSVAKKLGRALSELRYADDGTSAAPILIPRQKGRPVIAFPMRWPERLGDGQRNWTVVILVDLQTRAVPTEETLRACFGLTEGQARLAVLIGGGLSPRQAAGKLGISAETARNVLKRVFVKAGISRQSEWVALMMRLPAHR